MRRKQEAEVVVREPAMGIWWSSNRPCPAWRGFKRKGAKYMEVEDVDGLEYTTLLEFPDGRVVTSDDWYGDE